MSVTLQHCDLSAGSCCGYLTIKGLTIDYPSLCTFFDAEIIGTTHTFLTRKWEADQSVDVAHWNRFEGFAPYLLLFNTDGFVYNTLDSEDCVFMR